MVVVDHLSKMAYFRPCTHNNLTLINWPNYLDWQGSLGLAYVECMVSPNRTQITLITLQRSQ